MSAERYLLFRLYTKHCAFKQPDLWWAFQLLQHFRYQRVAKQSNHFFKVLCQVVLQDLKMVLICLVFSATNEWPQTFLQIKTKSQIDHLGIDLQRWHRNCSRFSVGEVWLCPMPYSHLHSSAADRCDGITSPADNKSSELPRAIWPATSHKCTWTTLGSSDSTTGDDINFCKKCCITSFAITQVG